MASNGETFSASIAAFAKKAPEQAREVVRKATIDLLTATVMRTPVGNPELWAVNRVARNYNTQVTEHNAALRTDPANLTKAGRLKPGKKLHDGMDIVAPAGYVGGRLRANWNASLVTPDTTTTDDIDKVGDVTTDRGKAVLETADGIKDIWIMNSLPYAIPIEYGHSKEQAPAGMVRISVAEFQAFVDQAAASVTSEQ